MPSHTWRGGGLTGSVGRTNVGSGVSVGVTAGVLVGAGVFVKAGVIVEASVGVSAGVLVSGMTICVGISISVGDSMGTGACVGAGAAPPQEVISKAMSRITFVLRTIETHFRIHAGQQAGSVVRDLISPEEISALCTFILPSRTVLNARVFPSGDQCGVSVRPFVKDVIGLSSPLWIFTR